MITINLDSFVIKNNGTIDHNATVDKFFSILSKYAHETSIEKEVIANAVNSVFDDFPTIRINQSALINYTLINLNVQIANYNYLRKKVKEYIKNNSGEKGESLFGVLKGKGGGICRWSTFG